MHNFESGGVLSMQVWNALSILLPSAMDRPCSMKAQYSGITCKKLEQHNNNTTQQHNNNNTTTTTQQQQ